MKKFTTFLTILKYFVTDEDLNNLMQRYEYSDTARKFTVSELVSFFTTAAMNEWKSFRHGSDVAESSGLARCDYSTISKKASDVPFEIFKDLFALVCSRCNRSVRRKLSFPKELLLIDSTTITVGKTRLLWAPYHGERAGVKLHTALNLSTQLPRKVIETTGLQHDSPILDQLVDSSCILVADRAYFQIERCDTFLEKKQFFVIRLKTNVEIFRRKSLQRIVDSNSNVTHDYTCRLGTEQKRSNSRHRIVEFTDYEGKLIRVVTNLHNVSAETIAAIYKARWGVEVFFRWIKQHLNVPRLFGTTKNAVYNQLYAALLSYVILRFIHLSISKTIRERKLSFLGFTRRLTQNDLPLEWRANLNHFLRRIAFL